MKAFVIYWRHGHKTIKRGATIEDAFRRAGYGAGGAKVCPHKSQEGRSQVLRDT